MSTNTVCFSLLLLIFITCCQSQNNNSFCTTSSCGNISEIRFPFRLKGDPNICGDPDYELDCENNQTAVMYFNSKKFIVESINYNNLTIRVVDPGLINPTTNCSFPVNSAINLFDERSKGAYTLLFDDYYVKVKRDKIITYNLPIVFISCIDPISYSSSRLGYIDISFCSRTGLFFNNPSSRTYRYIKVVDNTRMSDLQETCGVEAVAFASANGPLTTKNNSSLLDIHQGLAYGFDLSWYHAMCNDCHGFCHLRHNIKKIKCKHCPANVPTYLLDVRCDLLSFLLLVAFISGRMALSFIEWLLVVRFFIGLVCLMVLVVHKWRKRHLSSDETIEDFLQGQTNILPIKYSYSDIKKMTNKFKHKLGEGGYGIVYRGKLRSGPFVAVKLTKKSISSEREFANEVGTIGRVHHVNVVQLIGFCTEGSKHALVYEYMPNGSLDKYISPAVGQVALTYKNMFDISLGVARGIDYYIKGVICRFSISTLNHITSFLTRISNQKYQTLG